jgi:hypothetical protein
LLSLSTSALPEQHPSQPSLEWVTNDLLSRLPFDAYRSRNRVAGADSLPPKGRLDGCQVPIEPQGAHVTVAGDRSGTLRRKHRPDPGRRRSGFAHNAENNQRIRVACRIQRHLPWGSASFRRNKLRRSLCRITSPTPSTLRVSHPHSGLIPPEPCGFVSHHIRP